MDLGRARGVAPLLVAALVAALGVSVGVGGAASASARNAPSVTYRMSGTDSVAVSGRTASASPKVRIDRRVGSAWGLVKRIRAHHHRYATTLRLTAGTSVKLRVTSDRRSRTVVVTAPAATTSGTTATPGDASPPAAPQATQYDACGARPRKADGTLWSCTFDDEFSGTSLDRTKWAPQTVFASGTKDTYACYRDDPSNVDVSGGHLNLTLLKLDAPAPCGLADRGATPYQSGMVSTWHRFGQQYGRYEARVRNTASTAPGLHEAFWLWPDERVADASNWPVTGEIDISETYSAHDDLSIPFLHYSADGAGPQPGVNTAWNCTAYRGAWNTYVLEWTPSTITIYVNGKTCLQNTSGDPAFQKPYIVAFTQGLGQDANALTDQTPVPATMQVDYLRVWE